MRKKKFLLCMIIGASLSTGFNAVSFAGEWKQDATGYQYQDDNGSFIKSDWYLDKDGSWYYFDSNGYMQTGWILEREKWYYMDANGGYLITNQWIGNYFVGKDGAMLTDTLTPDGYKVGTDGKKIAKYRSLEDGEYSLLINKPVDLNAKNVKFRFDKNLCIITGEIYKWYNYNEYGFNFNSMMIDYTEIPFNSNNIYFYVVESQSGEVITITKEEFNHYIFQGNQVLAFTILNGVMIKAGIGS